ncbi:flagellar hook-associated protein FlgK [Patulibacter minatonensis]|uniref:flagellar hook-associated protein FlgK n=1 Tax=Patulibacter minatonensis TaxID=298163 RepID=UPI00047B29BA|nr:flagellar hook-associated protein FlgK [Patulibacter minatonensis]
MPISSFHGVETALRGLLAQQRAIDVTGHNIANQSTPGYSRQRVDTTASTSLTIQTAAGQAQLGSGVSVTGIQRIRDGFSDVQFRAQSTKLGEASTKASLLGQAELAFAEPGDTGLSAQLNRFWSAWSDVANSPTSSSARQVLLDTAKATATTFSALDDQLATVQSQAQAELTARTAAGGPIDLAARELAQLNGAIGQATARGETPNDLLDRRDVLLDSLSSYAQVRVEPTLDGNGDPVPGMIDVSLGSDPTPIVSGAQSRQPWTLAFPAGDPGSGSLGALASVASSTGPVAAYRTSIAQVASELATAVNGVHQAAGGAAIFTVPTGAIVSGTPRPPIAVAAAVDPVQGGALSAFVAGATGTNDVATAIAALRGGVADQHYTALVGQVGSEVAQSITAEKTASSLATALQDRRESVSGVAIDEEMANLVRFQRGYQAAARTLSVMDEMLDQLINRTGRVGL